ncbi:uncharacterized protein LOC143468217 isoform X2 [Clavelina lepadiformis]|uniref:uncharacterized protein LOC143468217 isoform X2 n=1 Tax=Clavelina lepadiformis TaxID=159417 RepID=UPI0040430C86
MKKELTCSQNGGLLVGAPKDQDKPKNSKSKSSDDALAAYDGSMYKCLLQGKKLKKTSCSKISIEIKPPKELIYSCDFEFCDLNLLLPGPFDLSWNKINTKTPSSGTGPSQDHTYENTTSRNGYYMYIEASDQNPTSRLVTGKSAMMETIMFSSTVGHCLRFWYHMYGDSIVGLNAYTFTNATGMKLIWNKDGNQGNQWKEGYVTVINEYPYKIIFEGIIDDWSADIALDDIFLYNGQCAEDLHTKGQSIGATMVQNPASGEMLTCAPTWKYNCSGEIHSSGVCYLFNKDLEPTSMSVLTPCRNQECSTSQLDLVFVIDASVSVGKDNFVKVKTWLRNIISTIPIGPNYVQVGVIVYASGPIVQFHLNAHYKTEDLRKAIMDMPYYSEGTTTGQAIDLAANHMLQEEYGMRPNVQHVIIVMTDGKSQDNVSGPSSKAKEKGITMFAIGVGNNVNEMELADISSSSEYIFKTDDYDALNTIKQRLEASIAALESQGKILTNEQGQAGMSAAFYNNALIIGAPGLDDWSGGFVSYHTQFNSSEPNIRVTTSFRDLLKEYTPTSDLSNERVEMNLTTASPTSGIAATVSSFPEVSTYSEISADSNRTTIEAITGHLLTAASSTATPLTSSAEYTSVSNTTTFFDHVATTKHNITRYDATFEPNRTDSATATTINSEYTQSTQLEQHNITSISPQQTTDHMNTFGPGLFNHTGVENKSVVATVFSTTQPNITARNTSQSAVDVDVVDDVDENQVENRKVGTYDTEDKGSGENPNVTDTINMPTNALPTTMLKTSTALINSSITIESSQHVRKRSVDVFEIDLPERKISQPFALAGEEDVTDLYSNAYLGYSVTSGMFFVHGQREIAFGAPRVLSFGSVFIIHTNYSDLNVKPNIMKEFRSKQMGSYFGYSVAATDTNGDGLDDLVVGAPTWMGSNEDEGRVFVYVTDLNLKTNVLQWKEIVLSGLKEKRARFGFSIATPGDLNMDGYNDLVVGAPSTADGDGAVFIYNGQPNGITTEPTQVIRSSKRKKKPIYFGFSLNAQLDIDDNGYNDLAIGAPGNNRVVVLLTKPVIHVAVTFSATPSLFNLTGHNFDAINETYSCGKNDTAICSTLSVCFMVSGVSIPSSVNFSYSLQPDVNQTLTKPRGRIDKIHGEVEVPTNSSQCETFRLYMKLPIKNQLSPIVTGLNFKLSDKMPTSWKSAVLDVFDNKPHYTSISFVKPCNNATCYSDLSMQCDVCRSVAINGSDNVALTLGSTRIIDFQIELKNSLEPAYDVEIDLEFHSSLYFIQIAHLSTNTKRCMQRVIESDAIKEKEDLPKPSEVTEPAESGRLKLKLAHKYPLMWQEESCKFKVQFGIPDNYKGGYLDFSFKSRSNSHEVNPVNNNCTARVLTKFKADLAIRGKSKDDQVKFSSSVSNHTREDIGPKIIHNYQIFNKGPTRIPNTSIAIQWPTSTPSGHGILYLTEIVCDPLQSCLCSNLSLLVDPDKLYENYNNTTSNLTQVGLSGEADEVDFAQRGTKSFRVDKNTLEKYTDASFECEQEKGTVCETLHCTLRSIEESQTINLQIHFRLWKRTFLKGKAWQVTISSNARSSTENSPYIVPPDGEDVEIVKATVATQALNADFSIIEDKKSGPKTPFWVYVVAIAVGLLLLVVVMLLLKRYGFFKSKYKLQLEEELQWQTTYRDNAVTEQSKLYEGSRDNPTGDQRLTTFQTGAGQSSSS